MKPEGFDENYRKYSEENGIIVICDHTSNSSQIIVFFLRVEKNISVEDINRMVNSMKTKEITRGIIISNKSMSSQAERLVTEIDIRSNYIIEVFKVNDLLVNISR